MSYKLLFLNILLFLFTSCAAQKVDVLVVGGGASGTAAGIQAARMGVNALIVEETSWLGGMLTSAGVSAVDGNYKLPSGIFGEFRDSLEKYYGGANALKTGWVSNVLFEPKVGNDILQKMAKAQAKLSVWKNTRFISSLKTADGWSVTVEKSGVVQQINAKIMIDATELGDVAKACGVKYDIGMEARSVCGEDIAPLVANDIVQDLTYVMILKDYGVNKTISKPVGYDASKFYCTAQSPNCTNPVTGQTVWSRDKLITYGKLPNGKYMINWPIEGNDFYVNVLEMNEVDRKIALDKAKQFSLGYLYYLQTQLGFSTYGLDDSQFPTVDNLPMIPYHRESRRIHGLVRFNVNHVTKPFDQPEALYRTGIAVGDYPVDHHHKRYPETEKLPDLHFYPVPSYCVPIGSLIPKDVEGLIVAEKSISVSNLLNGSTRLQPVVIQIGQAAGALAALSFQKNVDVANVAVRDVQNVLLNNAVYLLPYLDVPKSNPHFNALQRIGATGILKGEGKNVGWSNETWFNIDKTVIVTDLKKGISEFDESFSWSTTESELSINEAIKLLQKMGSFYKKDTITDVMIQSNWLSLGLLNFDKQRKITRKELAVLLNNFINPFDLRQVDFTGKYVLVPTENAIVNDSVKIQKHGNKLEVLGLHVKELKLYNGKGQIVRKSTTNSLETSGIYGFYILKITSGQTTETTIKILFKK